MAADEGSVMAGEGRLPSSGRMEPVRMEVEEFRVGGKVVAEHPAEQELGRGFADVREWCVAMLENGPCC